MTQEFYVVWVVGFNEKAQNRESVSWNVNKIIVLSGEIFQIGWSELLMNSVELKKSFLIKSKKKMKFEDYVSDMRHYLTAWTFAMG